MESNDAVSAWRGPPRRRDYDVFIATAYRSVKGDNLLTVVLKLSVSENKNLSTLSFGISRPEQASICIYVTK